MSASPKIALSLAAVVAFGCGDDAAPSSPVPRVVEPSPAPEPVAAPLPPVEPAVALGAAFGCVLRPPQPVSCFGSNRFGQLGDPSIEAGYRAYRASPAPVAGTEGAIAIGAGDFHVCASVGTEVRCWGHGGYGQLGDGAREDRAVPVAMRGLPPEARPVELALGNAHTCVRTEHGQVFCAGANTLGQLGDGTTDDRAELAPVRGLAEVRRIVAGRFHTCALRDDGSVSCWGAAIDGATGTTERALRERVVEPARVAVPRPARRLAAGGVRTCASDDAGILRCFGADVRRPTEHARIGEARALVVQTHYLAWLDADGAVHTDGAWPEQPEGLEGTPITPLPTPEEHLATLAAGPRHLCGLRPNGELACFGDEADGRLAR